MIELQPNSYSDTLYNLHRDDNNRLNPEGTGWIVRGFFNLTDDPDSCMVLREDKDDPSTESRIPLPAGAQLIVDTQRLYHAVYHPGAAAALQPDHLLDLGPGAARRTSRSTTAAAASTRCRWSSRSSTPRRRGGAAPRRARRRAGGPRPGPPLRRRHPGRQQRRPGQGGLLRGLTHPGVRAYLLETSVLESEIDVSSRYAGRRWRGRWRRAHKLGRVSAPNKSYDPVEVADAVAGGGGAARPPRP